MSRSPNHRTDSSGRDQKIVAQIVQGETAAIAELYDCYGRLVYSLIVNVVADSALAEDLVQEVFVRVWRSAATYRPEAGSVKNWLLAIAHNRAVDEHRRRVREGHRVSLDVAGQSGELAREDPPGEPLLARALQALPAEQRQAIELAYFHGLTTSDIAARLNLPLGTVKSRIRLGMARLRSALGVDGELS